MNQDVEHEMGENRQTHQCGRLPMPAGIAGGPGVIQGSGHHTPNDGAHQTVGDGIIVEFERKERGTVSNDPHVLPAQQQERSPEQVAQLHRQKQGAQRKLGLRALQSEGNPVVA